MCKTLVFGLDGLSYKVLKENIDSFSEFSKIISEGCYGISNSVAPVVTGPNWISLVTGVYPDEHGMTLEGWQEGEKCYDKVKVKTVWDILGENGIKSLIFNVPATYPVKEINGVMVGGFPGIFEKDGICIDDFVYDRLNKRGYIVDIANIVNTLTFSRGTNTKLYMNLLKEIDELKCSIFCELLKDDYDFAMVVFTGIDRISHLIWAKTGGKIEGEYGFNCLYGELLKTVYEFYNLLLQKIINRIGFGLETVMVVTDHGWNENSHCAEGFWGITSKTLNLKKGMGNFNVNITQLMYLMLISMGVIKGKNGISNIFDDGTKKQLEGMGYV